MSSFFYNIPKNIVIRYSYNFRTKKIQRGIVVYKQGDPVDGIYLVKKGELEVGVALLKLPQVFKNVNLNDREMQQVMNLKEASSQEDVVRHLTGPPSLMV
jgi:hypothetical protein